MKVDFGITFPDTAQPRHTWFVIAKAPTIGMAALLLTLSKPIAFDCDDIHAGHVMQSGGPNQRTLPELSRIGRRKDFVEALV